jgi:hypothetical protein
VIEGIENTLAYATYDDPINHLEPLDDESAASAAADGLRLILDRVFRGGRSADRILKPEVAYRRFTALTWLLRPELLGGRTQTEVAQDLGITKAGFSAIVVDWSTILGGMTNAGMKSVAARSSYRAVQLGHQSYRKDNEERAERIGTTKVTARSLTAEERRLAVMRQQFTDGGTWSKADRALAKRRRLLGSDGKLTPAGRAWVGPQGIMHTPLKESLSGVK